MATQNVTTHITLTVSRFVQRDYFRENRVINDAEGSFDRIIWYHDKLSDTDQQRGQVDAENQEQIEAHVQIIRIVLRMHNNENNI
jgi:hypothetical protein